MSRTHPPATRSVVFSPACCTTCFRAVNICTSRGVSFSRSFVAPECVGGGLSGSVGPGTSTGRRTAVSPRRLSPAALPPAPDPAPLPPAPAAFTAAPGGAPVSAMVETVRTASTATRREQRCARTDTDAVVLACCSSSGSSPRHMRYAGTVPELPWTARRVQRAFGRALYDFKFTIHISPIIINAHANQSQWHKQACA